MKRSTNIDRIEPGFPRPMIDTFIDATQRILINKRFMGHIQLVHVDAYTDVLDVLFLDAYDVRSPVTLS